MKTYIQEPSGVTEESRRYVEKHLPEIGDVLAVVCFQDKDRGCTTLMIGTRGNIWVDGFAWGYGGEGPRGLLWLLKDKLGVPVSIQEIAGLSPEGPHIWKVQAET